MPIQITLNRWQLQLSTLEQSLAQAATSRRAMQAQFQSALAQRSATYQSILPLHIREDTLQQMTNKYSEQLVYCPLKEMQYWFTYSSGAFLQPGYPPLFYHRNEHRSIAPNKSAIAGIGEGIAGFLAQRLYHCRKLARPSHDYPDIVMEGNGKTYLVESKATLSQIADIKTVIEAELARMVVYAAACARLETRPVVGLLVGTALVSETDYHSYLIEVAV